MVWYSDAPVPAEIDHSNTRLVQHFGQSLYKEKSVIYSEKPVTKIQPEFFFKISFDQNFGFTLYTEHLNTGQV
jgi:hypothetical protein